MYLQLHVNTNMISNINIKEVRAIRSNISPRLIFVILLRARDCIKVADWIVKYSINNYVTSTKSQIKQGRQTGRAYIITDKPLSRN